MQWFVSYKAKPLLGQHQTTLFIDVPRLIMTLIFLKLLITLPIPILNTQYLRIYMTLSRSNTYLAVANGYATTA